VRRTTYTDLAAHATFIGFYIPETPYTFAICEYLAAQWESILTDSRKEEVVQFTDPGDADWMNVNKFTITGQV